MFFGSIIFEFLGATVHWLYKQISFRIKRKTPPTFAQVFDGPEEEDPSNEFMYGFINIVVGMGFILLIVKIIMWSGV